MSKLPRFECAVIGGGPGGLLATLYLRRYKRSVLLVQHGEPRAKWIPKIRNLVGHTEGLTGPELMQRLQRQAMRMRPNLVKGEARVERLGRRFLVRVEGNAFEADKVILATGMEDVQPPFANFAQLRARALLAYCPICDGLEHCDDTVGLLVRDNSGLDKMRFLAKFCPDLHILLTEKFRISAKHRREMEKLGARCYEFPLLGLEADGRRALLAHFRGRRPLRLRLAYVELGARVRDEAFRELRGLRKTKQGFLMVSYHQETSIPGLFAVGDCVNALAQVSVAAGQAAIAATRVHNDLPF